jgi:hypothetical protein
MAMVPLPSLSNTEKALCISSLALSCFRSCLAAPDGAAMRMQQRAIIDAADWLPVQQLRLGNELGGVGGASRLQYEDLHATQF